MAGNTFGEVFRLTTFGESHGAALGGIVDGCPAGMTLDMAFIEREMARRRAGVSPLSSARAEADEVEFLSGLFEGKTTGAPISFLVRNVDQRPADYDHLKDVYRPSHADFTYDVKYGIRDHRGGGRASARETVARVAGGAIAKQLIGGAGMTICAYVSRIGEISLDRDYLLPEDAKPWDSPVRCPDAGVSLNMTQYLEQVRAEGDTVGGIVTCVIRKVPAGLGEPVFDKLQADLAKAMLSIGAAKGFGYGSGFASARMKGSAHNDVFIRQAGGISTKSNFSGGIQGGISNGRDIYFNVAFKPVSSIAARQETVDRHGRETTVEIGGRHDPCIAPRATAVVEAMAALVMADHLLRNRCSRIT
jgi:chorismate synthase